jgi:uncharacterized membrane protein YedE/YeeE
MRTAMSLSDFAGPLAGGLLIGAAALVLYATVGRIAGISGIAYGTAWTTGAERAWRLVFLGGLLAGGWAAALAFGALPAPAPATAATGMLALASGVLVGFGTRLGNGCTSGHGVCGIARLSPRSLVSVLVFMALGMVTATLIRPLLL